MQRGLKFACSVRKAGGNKRRKSADIAVILSEVDEPRGLTIPLCTGFLDSATLRSK